MLRKVGGSNLPSCVIKSAEENQRGCGFNSCDSQCVLKSSSQDIKMSGEAVKCEALAVLVGGVVLVARLSEMLVQIPSVTM